MKFTLTALGGVVLRTMNLESLSVTTSEGALTVLPGHMPLIAAIVPCVITAKFEGKSTSYVLWGGVLQIEGNAVSIIADIAEEGEQDIESIRVRKTQAEALMAEYRAKGDPISMEALIELEQEYLKDSAREQLALR